MEVLDLVIRPETITTVTIKNRNDLATGTPTRRLMSMGVNKDSNGLYLLLGAVGPLILFAQTQEDIGGRVNIQEVMRLWDSLFSNQLVSYPDIPGKLVQLQTKFEDGYELYPGPLAVTSEPGQRSWLVHSDPSGIWTPSWAALEPDWTLDFEDDAVSKAFRELNSFI